jgi:glycosyltransferase involved in cell wall biosynthesis
MFIIKQLVKKIFKKLQFYKGFKKYELLIYDDIFPHPISGFRYEEFTRLLEEFDNTKIIINPNSYKVISSNISDHKSHINEYLRLNSRLKNKISSIRYFNNINSKLFYCVFLNNIHSNIDWIEKFKIPFVFTLYPGGGFQVNSQIINKKLSRVFSSPMFRKVIVTQQYTKNYLIKNSLCDPSKVEFIFGCVVPQISISDSHSIRQLFNKNKDVFDIVFCAAKYTEKGEDKGYDTFIDFAKSISVKYDFVRFHIIGGFDENVIDVTFIRDKVKFYGYKKFEELAAIFKKMDIIISPNKPFLLHDGAFDGFPLGTVVEAGLNGVVALVSDDLNENEYFENEKDIVLIENDAYFITKKVEYLIENPELMFEISKNGCVKFSELYSNDLQMKRRIDILRNQVLKN